MWGTTSRRGGGSKQRNTAVVSTADASRSCADESPRFTSGSAKAEALGRGAGSTVGALPGVLLLIILGVVGTVFAGKMAWSEVGMTSHAFTRLSVIVPYRSWICFCSCAEHLGWHQCHALSAAMKASSEGRVTLRISLAAHVNACEGFPAHGSEWT